MQSVSLLLLTLLLLPPCHGFVVLLHGDRRKTMSIRPGLGSTSTFLTRHNSKKQTSWSVLHESTVDDAAVQGVEDVRDDDEEEESTDLLADTYGVLGVATGLTWTLVALTVLLGQDPRFAHCTMRHNVLNAVQAVTFPLPILWATIMALRSAATIGWTRLKSQTYRRLNLGLAVTSLWLMFSTAFPKPFCFGYDLIPVVFKLLGILVHGATAALALAVWAKTVGNPSSGQLVSRAFKGFLGSWWKVQPAAPSDDPDKSNGLSTLYSLISIGFFWFTILPLVTLYPMASVPSILGKRLSRPFAAFTWLAAVASYCLKDAADRDRLAGSTFVKLSNGLMLGSVLHSSLILLKLIGIDGGGFLLPGNSLWEVYPDMLAVPFCTTVSLLLHSLVVWAGWSRSEVTAEGSA